jgi:hypothetical protein
MQRRVVVAEVPAVDVVHQAVVVVVDTVAGDLVRVGPGAILEIRMVEVDPVVDDRHDDGWLPMGDAQGLEAIDVDVRDACLGLGAGQALPGVVETPLAAEPGLGGDLIGELALIVRSDGQDPRIGIEPAPDGGGRDPLADDDLRPAGDALRNDVQTEVTGDRTPLRGRDIGAIADEHLVARSGCDSRVRGGHAGRGDGARCEHEREEQRVTGCAHPLSSYARRSLDRDSLDVTGGS